MDNFIIIGYGGHAFVAIDIIQSMGHSVEGYCDFQAKENNPYKLKYIGREDSDETIEILTNQPFFVAIGDNNTRGKISMQLKDVFGLEAKTIVHHSAVISNTSKIGIGVMIAANATINPLAAIGDGVICNTGCIIEHDCQIGNYSHIGPGAVLCGNVQIGKGSFVGANSVIKQGVKIGNFVTIGAGSVIINDIPSDKTVVGNPAREI